MICEHSRPDWRDCEECHIDVEAFLQREKAKVPEILCNLCGESCALCDGPKPGGEPVCNGGLLNACVSGGWNSTPGNGSGALDDLEAYRFDICEYCLDWIFSQCRIPLIVSFAVGNAPDEPFRPAKDRLEGRKYGAFFLAEKNRRDALRGRPK